MRSGIGTVIFAVLAAGHCCYATASEPEFQITPRIGFGSIELDPGASTVVDDQDDIKSGPFDVGLALGYVTPIGVMLEVGAQRQSDFSFGAGDRVTFKEQFVAAGFQLEFGPGFRLTPKVGRTRWDLDIRESRFLNPGREREERSDGYENFWDVSLTKTVLDWMSMGARYRSTEYEFGRVESTMFVVTFGFR